MNWYNDPKNKEEYRLGGKFTDPILILTDAYSKSTDNTVRHDIAVAIRHSFMGLGVVGKDDNEFVENAVKWYARHKDRVELNRKYTANSAAAQFFHYQTNPLFVLKPLVEKP